MQEKRPPTTVKTKTKVGCRLHYISEYSNLPDCKEARQHRSLATVRATPRSSFLESLDEVSPLSHVTP